MSIIRPASSRRLLLPLLVALSFSPVHGQSASESEPLRYDNRGRPVVAAQVNDRGPYFMVLDSAAQQSLLSPLLAAQLGITPVATGINIVGVTGSTTAQAIPIDRIGNSLFERRKAMFLLMPNAAVTPARGILGMDLFAGRKLLFDRVAGLVSAPASGPAPSGFVTLAGEMRNGILVVPVQINDVTVKAAIDTGAATTLANPALLHAIGWRDDDPRLKADGEIRGATAETNAVRVATVDTLKLGPATLRQVPIDVVDGQATSDIAAAGEPMLLIGANLLDLLDAYAIDFPRAELQIRTPARAAAQTGG